MKFSSVYYCWRGGSTRRAGLWHARGTRTVHAEAFTKGPEKAWIRRLMVGRGWGWWTDEEEGTWVPGRTGSGVGRGTLSIGGHHFSPWSDNDFLNPCRWPIFSQAFFLKLFSRLNSLSIRKGRKTEFRHHSNNQFLSEGGQVIMAVGIMYMNSDSAPAKKRRNEK